MGHNLGSRINLHGDDGENGILVPPAHHHSECATTFDGGADICRRWYPLTIDGDDDVMLF